MKKALSVGQIGQLSRKYTLGVCMIPNICITAVWYIYPIKPKRTTVTIGQILCFSSATSSIYMWADGHSLFIMPCVYEYILLVHE